MKSQFILSLPSWFVEQLVKHDYGFTPASDIQFNGKPLSDPDTFKEWLAKDFSTFAFYAQRERLEKDLGSRHVIPYIRPVNSKGETYVYSRTNASGEAGLHSRVSICLGGHVDLANVKVIDSPILGDPLNSTPDFYQTLLVGAHTELNEELGLNPEDLGELVFDGLIVMTGPVNEVHVAFVMSVQVTDSAYDNEPEDTIQFLEAAVPCAALAEKYSDRMEDWSRVLCESL